MKKIMEVAAGFFMVAGLLAAVIPLNGVSKNQNPDVVREWYAYVDGRIALNTSFDPRPLYLTPPPTQESPVTYAFKPVPSPDGSQIAFFKVVDKGHGQDITWKTKICVMNADGSNLRELTGGEFMDTNPMWTRDGSNRIMWTRMEKTTEAFRWLVHTAVPLGMNIYWTRPDAKPGEEEKISASDLRHRLNFVYSGLKDGRVLVRVDVFNRYYLMTPAPYNNGKAKYEPISYPFKKTLLHKMSISMDETKIAYMKVADAGIATNGTGAAYTKAVIAVADFDPISREIKNEVEVTEYNEANVTWYTSFSPESDKLLFACVGKGCPAGDTKPGKGQIFQYDLKTKTITKLSANDDLDYRYPAVKGVVK